MDLLSEKENAKLFSPSSRRSICKAWRGENFEECAKDRVEEYLGLHDEIMQW